MQSFFVGVCRREMGRCVHVCTLMLQYSKIIYASFPIKYGEPNTVIYHLITQN